jgi:Ca-activated chloride channel family protein
MGLRAWGASTVGQAASGPLFCSLLLAGVVSWSQAQPKPAVTGNEPTLRASVETSAPPVPIGKTPTLHAAADLVLVPVTVTDTLNHQIMGLHKADFTIFDQDQPRDIHYFSSEDGPISVGLILDFSKSMADKIDVERAAVEAFFNDANADDDYFVITVSTKPTLVATEAQSIDSIESKIGLTEPGGATALLDAIYLGVAQMRHARYPRHALVILSDGGDNSSHYRMRQIKDTLREADVATYAIGIFDTDLFKTFEEYMGRKWLEEITDATGGRTIAVHKPDAVPDAAAKISWELRNQYVLGFKPATLNSGKWRKIRVRVSPAPPLSSVEAHYRRGYFAP